MVRGIVDPLAEAHISVHDVITSATSVAVFVDWADRERALEIIQREF
jgi:aspartate kinase